MDSRIREALEVIRGTIDRARPYENESGVIKISLGDFCKLRKLLSILTAEPEPCESSNEWDALTKEDMWNEIQDIRRLVDSDGTKSICSDIEDYATQVSDKRAEELRAALNKMVPIAEAHWWYLSAKPIDNPEMRKDIDDAKDLSDTEPKT